MHEAYAARLAKDALAPLLQAVSATRSEALADAAVGVLRNLLLHADATFTTSKLPAHAFLPLLVSALESGRPQPIENATAALWKLSELPAHHMRIAGLGGIQLLAAAASDAETEPDALEAAVGALANLALRTRCGALYLTRRFRYTLITPAPSLARERSSPALL